MLLLRLPPLRRRMAAPAAPLLARRTLASTPATPVKPLVPFGIAFDIDGVLVRGGTPIPGASRVLDYLVQAQHLSGRIPFIFITNGGGCLEEDKAKEISDVFFPELPHKIRHDQVMLSHTPMKALLPTYKDKQVLVLGSKDYVNVCRAYGFNHVVTVEDVLHAHPELYPFKTYHKRHDLHPDPFSGTYVFVGLVDLFDRCSIVLFGSFPFFRAHPTHHPTTAIFVMHDPVDWAPEIQVLCDLVEGGVLVTHPQHANRKAQIPVYSSNSDLVFSSTYGVPRLAQGAFFEAWKAVYKTCYGGKDLDVTRYGKPYETSYRHAEKMLVHEARLLGLLGKDPLPHEAHPDKAFPIKKIYAIGDNPLSDVDGTWWIHLWGCVCKCSS